MRLIIKDISGWIARLLRRRPQSPPFEGLVPPTELRIPRGAVRYDGEGPIRDAQNPSTSN